MSVEQLE